MSRTICYVPLVLALPFLMGQGCGAPVPSGNGNRSPLIGQWLAQTPAACTGAWEQILEFRDDGTGLFDNVYNCGGTNLVEWSVSGSELTVKTNTAFGDQVYGFSIDGTTLSVTRGNGLVADTFVKQ